MDARIQKAIEELEKLYAGGGFSHLTPLQFFTVSRVALAIWDQDKTKKNIDSKIIRAWLTTYRPAYL